MVYRDSEGAECNLLQMVKREPEWAASRVIEGDQAIKRVSELEHTLKEITTDLHDVRSDLHDVRSDLHDVRSDLLLFCLFIIFNGKGGLMNIIRVGGFIACFTILILGVYDHNLVEALGWGAASLYMGWVVAKGFLKA
jgi:hypothetical protein